MLGGLTLDGKQREEDTWYAVSLGDVCEEIVEGQFLVDSYSLVKVEKGQIRSRRFWYKEDIPQLLLLLEEEDVVCTGVAVDA